MFLLFGQKDRNKIKDHSNGVDSKNIQNPDTQKNFDEIATQMYPVENMEHLALTQATQRRSCPEHSTDDDEKQTSTNPFSTPENMKNSSNTFSDWHFIEKSPVNTESDDDSIVIIEREVCRPMDSASLTSSESDNDEIDYFADVDHDSHLTDKNVEAAESPLYSLVALPNGQLFDQMTESKILSHLITYLIVISMLTIGLVFSTRNNAKPVDLDTVTQLQSAMRLRKTLIDDLFAYQVEILNHVRRISDDVYLLNLHQFAQIDQIGLSTKVNAINSLLESASTERPPCDLDITAQFLPLVCVDNDDVFLMLSQEQLKVAFNDIVSFLQETGTKYSAVDDGLIYALSMKSGSKFDEKTPRDANSFAQDCDNFSKNYRPNFCAKTDDFDACVKNAEDCGVENEFSFARHIASELEPEGDRNGDKKITEEFKEFIRKFKNDFEHLYGIFMREMDRRKVDVGEKSDGDENTRSQSEEGVSAPFSPAEDESKENLLAENEALGLGASVLDNAESTTSVSGEWLLNLNAARAKLREYYEEATNGNWLLELGKARESWRRNQDEEIPEVMENPPPRPRHKERGKKKDKFRKSDDDREKYFEKRDKEERREGDAKPWYKKTWDYSNNLFKPGENRPWRKVWEAFQKWYRKEGSAEELKEDGHKPWYKMSWEESKKWFKTGNDEEKPWYTKSWEKYKNWYKKEKDEDESWYSWYNKPSDDTAEWYKTAPKKFKDDFKKFTTKWKSRFKKLKEGLLDNYEKYVPSNLQVDFRNMWYF